MREHLVEIGARLFRIDAAQRVIGAKLENDAVGLGLKRPVEPFEAPRCRVAGNTGIDDFDLVSLRLKSHLKLRCEGVAGFDAVAGGQTIAESDEGNRSWYRPPLRSRCRCRDKN